MSADRDADRIVRSWLDEGVTTLPDRVLDAVLDQVPATPQRRLTWWPARRTPTLNTYARLGLVAAAVLAVVIVEIGLFGGSTDVGPPVGAGSPAPSVSPSAAAAVDPLVGTWVAPVVTCNQEIATVEAAGFTAEQMTLSGWTCPSGTTNQYSFQIGGGQGPNRTFAIYDEGVLAFPGSYHFVGGTTFEVLSESADYCLTYRYVIDGDQLTIEMTDRGCPTTGEAPLNDQIAQTAVFETSPFTRQP